jgi:hypothetical protein
MSSKIEFITYHKHVKMKTNLKILLIFFIAFQIKTVAQIGTKKSPIPEKKS